MVWEVNGTPLTLVTIADDMDITNLTPDTFNQFLSSVSSSAANQVTANWTFENNSNAVYARRQSVNGGVDGTATDVNFITQNIGVGAFGDQFTNMQLVSISDEEKLLNTTIVWGNTAGSGNAPEKIELVGKFVPSPDSAISRVDLNNTGTGSFQSGDNLSAFGDDLDVPPVVPVGGWVEVGRTTLGATGDIIDVTGIPNKKYYMILAYGLIGSGNTTLLTRMGNGTIDTGNSYAQKRSLNGGADATTTNANHLNTQTGTFGEAFHVEHLSNFPSGEKLLQHRNVQRASAGAGTAPSRETIGGKWANTVNPMDIYRKYNGSTGDLGIGSECVVLEWDPDDTHTDNFWQELYSGNGNAGLDTGPAGFTGNRYLWIQCFMKDTLSGGQVNMFLNGLESGYATRYSINGASDVTTINDTNNRIWQGLSAENNLMFNCFIVNNGSNEQMGIFDTSSQETSDVTTAPDVLEGTFKNASTAQITDIEIRRQSGSFGAESILKIWGSD